jgi:hypothetical protein
MSYKAGSYYKRSTGTHILVLSPVANCFQKAAGVFMAYCQLTATGKLCCFANLLNTDERLSPCAACLVSTATLAGSMTPSHRRQPCPTGRLLFLIKDRALENSSMSSVVPTYCITVCELNYTSICMVQYSLQWIPFGSTRAHLMRNFGLARWVNITYIEGLLTELLPVLKARHLYIHIRRCLLRAWIQGTPGSRELL